MRMGSSERRIACLKLAASMQRRITKEDEAPTAAQLVEYAKELDCWAFHGRTVAEQAKHDREEAERLARDRSK